MLARSFVALRFRSLCCAALDALHSPNSNLPAKLDTSYKTSLALWFGSRLSSLSLT